MSREQLADLMPNLDRILRRRDAGLRNEGGRENRGYVSFAFQGSIDPHKGNVTMTRHFLIPIAADF
jgi:hypothetical protein